MGFLESLSAKAMDMAKQNYKNVTGRNYDRDFRDYVSQYEYKSEYEIQQRWDELRDDNSVRHFAEKNAVRDFMKQYNLDLD